MNIDEEIAEKYLRSCGYGNIPYEPDGKDVLPDFLVNGKIAVEVRRLNKHHKRSNGNPKGLEDVRYRLVPMLENLLKGFEGDQHDSSAFVRIKYSRPIMIHKPKVRKHIKKKIMQVLTEHSSKIKDHSEYQISDSIVLKIFPASKRLKSQYVLGGAFDKDVGGYVVSEVYEALKIVLDEKTKKISKKREKYGKWWLILVDHISHGLSEDESKQLKESPFPEHDFDKVVLISRRNPEYAVEI